MLADGAPDDRVANTAAALDVVNTALPYFKRMHEMTPDEKHEEINLLAMDFSSMFFETMAPMPTWRDYYRSTDQTPAYEYLKRVLKVLQFLRGGDRWVLKSPQHLEQFGPLSAVFPDATYVVTHRDPVSVTASLVTMMTYLARLNLETVDPKVIGGYWADRLETMHRACVSDRELLATDRSIDVRFDEFMADDVAMVERIYAIAEQPHAPARPPRRGLLRPWPIRAGRRRTSGRAAVLRRPLHPRARVVTVPPPVLAVLAVV